jgi:hypothetical protein
MLELIHAHALGLYVHCGRRGRGHVLHGGTKVDLCATACPACHLVSPPTGSVMCVRTCATCLRL